MGFLISADWLIGEAADLHIAVTAAAVHHHFERLRHQLYPKRGAYRMFLQHSGETTADILLRTRLSMLSERVQRRVAKPGESARAQRRALTRFVKRFKGKWTAETYCEPLYATQDCGHTATAL